MPAFHRNFASLPRDSGTQSIISLRWGRATVEPQTSLQIVRGGYSIAWQVAQPRLPRRYGVLRTSVEHGAGSWQL